MGSQSNPYFSFTTGCRDGAATSSVIPAIDPLLKAVFATGTQDTDSTFGDWEHDDVPRRRYFWKLHGQKRRRSERHAPDANL
jgi:hypothetical protein